MNNEKNEYEVGYKRPPVASRFKKGNRATRVASLKKLLRSSTRKNFAVDRQRRDICPIEGKGKRMLKARNSLSAAIH